MNVEQDTLKSTGHMQGHQVFPANISSLLALIGIIVLTFSLSILAFFSY